ncbi:type II secretion system protein GspL [Marinobacter zhejiangensis]|uniref:Type II secretion system protein L n=1 Tax=Marinobacter zhejiangensis TaxID=488535 RepID=A0A1I4PER2_9GAMM|nr:type II secretion system protein GspL [Marinobacter zhejiangensis]SFM25913.1 general secretion pathway protein L [Marinobacter zhejiangensis]
MSYRLYVHCDRMITDESLASRDVVFNWVLVDAGGDVQAKGSDDTRDAIEQILVQNALDNVNMIGLIPGDEVLFCLADIPAKQSRYIRQALAFSVEEQLAQDVESMHLALGKRGDEGHRVAAIDRGAMTRWYQLLNDWENTRLTAIYPDAALLPVQGSGWSICLAGESALLSSAQGEWLRMKSANLAMFVGTLAMPREDEVIAEISVALYADQQSLDDYPAVEAELSSNGVISLNREVIDITPVELLAHSHFRHLCEPVNLCEGDFATDSRKTSALRPWRPLIAVACTWFVLQVGLEIGLGYYQQHQAEQLREQAMAIYRQHFPDDRRAHAGNIQRVLQGQLRVAGNQGGSSDFLSLIKQTGQQFEALPGKEAVTFSSLNYSQSRGELIVDLRADTFNKLSALRNGLVQQGLDADIGSVVNEASGARGRLTISGG